MTRRVQLFAMSENKAKGPNDLTLKDVALYLTVIVVALGAGAAGIAPMPLMTGLAAGSGEISSAWERDMSFGMRQRRRPLGCQQACRRTTLP